MTIGKRQNDDALWMTDFLEIDGDFIQSVPLMQKVEQRLGIRLLIINEGGDHLYAGSVSDKTLTIIEVKDDQFRCVKSMEKYLGVRYFCEKCFESSSSKKRHQCKFLIV